MIKKMAATLLLSFALLPLSAHEGTDTVYTFRFVPQDDMFYVPYSGNARELARLEECVERYRQDILAGKIPLHVDGWCSSGESEADNLAMAKIRSNRVKSELIVRRQLTEACFITRNHSGSGDYVTVGIAVPKEESRFVAGQIRADSKVAVHPDAVDAAEKTADETVDAPEETPDPAVEGTTVNAAEKTMEETADAAKKAAGTDGYTLALRANLLRWATLTPDLGLEWRISPSWGILVNGSWTSWSWNDKDRRYALWEVMGGHAGSAPVYGQGEARLSGRNVQGRAVQLQALRHRQAGRPDGRRHHGRLPAAAKQSLVAGLQYGRGLSARGL